MVNALNKPNVAVASPQLEDGYTRIANEILEALANRGITGRLTSYDFSVLLAVIRKTYGYQKKADWISNGQLVEMTGLSKQNVARSMRGLCKRHFLLRSGKTVGLNKNYLDWEKIIKKQKLSPETTTSPIDQNSELSPVTTKVVSGDVKSSHRRWTQNSKKENTGVSPKDGEPLTGESENLEPPTKENLLTPARQILPLEGEPTGLDPAGPLPPSSDAGPGQKARRAAKPKKQTDPRIAEAIKYFVDTCQEIKGFPPEITGGKDGSNVKRALQTMALPEIKDCIRDFLKGDKSKKLDVTLSAALSTATRNTFKANKAEDNTVIPRHKQRQYAMQENNDLPAWKREAI